MANDKKSKPALSKGFQEVPLSEGFQEVPLSDEDQQTVSDYISQPEVPLTESARAGLASGGTFGLGNRIGAAGGAAAEKLAGAPMGEEGFPLVPGMDSSKDKKLSDLYNEYLQYNKKREATAADANPITYHGAQFVGAMASPLNKIGAVGQLPKDASMLAKMGHGALAGARMGTLAGAASSPDLTNPAQTVENAGEGAAFGAGLGAGMPPVIGGVKALAGGTANVVRPLIGKPGSMFGKGMQAGMEGAPNLAGEPGQLQAIEERGKFADQFVKDLNDIINSNAKNKRELVAKALEKSQLAPKDAVDAITQKYLQANPRLNEDTARKELGQLKEMIVTALEGPEKTEVVRHYTGGPRPMPGSAAPPMPGAPEMPPPEMGAPGPSDIAPQQNALAPAPESPSQTPSDFAGYEAVHKATIEKGDEKAKEAFQHKIHEKLADEEALGLNHNDSPIQIEEHEIPGSDKVRLIAKRAKIVESGDEFKDQAKALTQQQKEQERLQSLLDRQNEEKLKFQQQQDVELAKPQFQDETVTTREGGRNLQDPEQLYALQKNLQAKSQFSEGRGFSSQEMNKMSGDAAKDIAKLIKMTIPDTIPVDERLNAFNNVAERLGINTDKLNIPGGEGQKARADAMSKILGILKPKEATDQSQMSGRAINYVKNELNRVHPDIGNAFEQEAEKHATNKGTIEELVKPETVGGGGPILSSIRRGINKTAYNTGYGLGGEVEKMSPMVHGTKQLFENYTPEALKRAGSAAAQSTNQAVQQLGQVLTKLADSDDRTRNSMMFVLEQQAGYREMMSPYFEKTESGTAQAKDKGLEKFK